MGLVTVGEEEAGQGKEGEEEGDGEEEDCDMPRSDWNVDPPW